MGDWMRFPFWGGVTGLSKGVSEACDNDLDMPLSKFIQIVRLPMSGILSGLSFLARW